MSSGSESDEDYVPGEPEQLSEEESANEETDAQFENEQDQKAKKRKLEKEGKGKKKRKTRNGITEVPAESPEKKQLYESEEQVNPEEAKKKEDDLWAKFLEGTDTKPKAAAKATSSVIETPKPVVNKEETRKIEQSSDDRSREQRIFEFAGETIVVENNTIKEKIKTTESPAAGSQSEASSTRRGPAAAGGLSNVLGQLNKKNKLSTLEKSKLDWLTYKKDEGIEEEIDSHNKGKNGYLDRRDFLERADVRQYEIERDMRMTRRSNR